MTEEEAYCLNDGLHRERDAHGSYALRIDSAHEIGVGEIVHARRQHTDDCRDCHRENDSMNWCMSQESVVVSLSFHAAKVRSFVVRAKKVCLNYLK